MGSVGNQYGLRFFFSQKKGLKGIIDANNNLRSSISTALEVLVIIGLNDMNELKCNCSMCKRCCVVTIVLKSDFLNFNPFSSFWHDI